jgi:hypothetical protein
MNFDPDIYTFFNPDLRRYPKQSLYKHFVMHGKREGRKYNVKHLYSDFDVEEYKELNPDLKFKENIDYERHFVLNGIAEKRVYKKIDKLLEYEKTQFPNEKPAVFDWIDKILYINLDSRVDRRLLFLKECERVGVPANRLHRIDAILNEKRGAIGCTRSHIQALTYAIDNNLNNILIFEDDVNFIENLKTIYIILKLLEDMKDKFDVVQLTAFDIKPRSPYLNFLDKCNYCTMGTGYIVNKSFMKKLRDNMLKGVEKLEETNQNQYTMDHYWNTLQPVSKWYTLKNRIIYQRKSYSDNENTVTNYKC